jgi:hypothetical protein
MYRLYVDETGNADLRASVNPNHRYLSLSGIAMDLSYAALMAFPRLEALKAKFFGSHPDEPIVFHRKDMVDKKRPFQVLRDPKTETKFNDALLAELTALEYTVISVVIDKLDHLNRYTVWRHDPYHYCLEVLLERYIMWLKSRRGQGDVMGEVRGGRPDRRLEQSFAGLYANGTENISSQETQKYLTSKKLKLKPKAANVSGLQMADMIANPSAMYVRSLYQAGTAPTKFGGLLVKILVSEKYRRSWNGRLRGYGIKWLP